MQTDPRTPTTKNSPEQFTGNVRLNAVCPGTIDTPMVSRMVDAGDLDLDAALSSLPVRRHGTRDDIAPARLWLCSPGSSFVTGVALRVYGGFTAQ